MIQMRFVFLLWIAGAYAAEGGDAIGSARRLMDSGNPQLALHRVLKSQPVDVTALNWAEWETLRLSLLLRTGRYDDLLARVAALPAAMPEPMLSESLNIAGRAAVAAGRGELSREYAARVLWQHRPVSAEERHLRLRVIESLAADKKGADAYRSMLRFQQDYRPIDRNTAELFVEILLDLDMTTEALSWLGNLDESSAARQLLRLRTGQLAADMAIAQARAMLGRCKSRSYWKVIEQAARQKRDHVVLVEALENLLHLDDSARPQLPEAQSTALWREYLIAAREEGNRKHLLANDDLGWAGLAASQLVRNAPSARTFLAYLSHQAQSRETRHQAQQQLVMSLETQGLELAALRLFQYAPPTTEAIDGRTRYLLGTIAEKHGLSEVALYFWGDLNSPPNVVPEEWRMRMASVNLRAGKMERSAAILKDVLSSGRSLPPAQLKRGVAFARDMLDAGRPDLARDLFEVMLPVVDTAQGREVLFALGRISDLSGQSPVAADYFMRAALPAGKPVADAMALQARLHAALNLARAGNNNEARAQFEWVIRNSGNKAQIELARGELKKL